MDLRRQPIFALLDNRVAAFEIYPEAAINCHLKDYIVLGGGKLLTSNDNDPHKITILDYDFYFNILKVEIPVEGTLPRGKDYFRPSFLHDCWEAGKLMDLNNYRHGKSAFLPYNANDILTKKTTWAELIRIPEEPATTSRNGDRIRTMDRIMSSACKPSRKSYTKREGQKILRFIAENNYHCKTGGNSMWKHLEESKILKKRPWQSIREHFRKTILPKLSEYEFSPENTRKIMKSVEEMRKNQGRAWSGRGGDPEETDSDSDSSGSAGGIIVPS